MNRLILILVGAFLVWAAALVTAHIYARYRQLQKDKIVSAEARRGIDALERLANR